MKSKAASLPEAIPDSFHQLRPWVPQGWEMVLLAAELIRPESPLVIFGAKGFSKNYELHCKQALEAWQWSPQQLLNTLEDVRRESIKTDAQHWRNLHQPFPGVVERLSALNSEEISLVVLTTKGADFTEELLDYFHLKPKLLFGHESGTKTELLLQLNQKYITKNLYLIPGLLLFVVDRKLV